MEISQQVGFGYTVRYQSEMPSSVEEEETIAFNLSPVPAHETLRIELAKAGAYSYDIVDMTGKILESKKIPNGVLNHAISVEALSQGLYLISLSDQNTGIKTSRVFVKE